MGLSSTSGRRRGRGHPAEQELAVARVELAEPQKAAGDELALSLRDLRPVHGTSEGAEGVHALAGLLPEEFREGVANLGQFLRQLARRLVKVFSGVGCALSDLEALARNVGAALAVARATRVSFSSLRSATALSCSRLRSRWAILVMSASLVLVGSTSSEAKMLRCKLTPITTSAIANEYYPGHFRKHWLSRHKLMRCGCKRQTSIYAASHNIFENDGKSTRAGNDCWPVPLLGVGPPVPQRTATNVNRPSPW